MAPARRQGHEETNKLMVELVFLILGLITVACALMAVTRRNPIYSAMFMMACMLAVAGLFVLLASPFLAVMQVLLYAGAIMVLFTFVIMLLNLRPDEFCDEPPVAHRLSAGVIALLLFGLLVSPVLDPSFAEDHPSFGSETLPMVNFPAGAGATEPANVTFGSVRYFGRALFGRFVLPFELVSVLVTAAVVAVMVLAKRDLRGHTTAVEESAMTGDGPQ